MIKKIFFSIGFTIGLFIGWALGFIRVPYIESNTSFWVGFIAALAFVSLVQMFLILQNSTWVNRLGRGKTDMLSTVRSNIFVWIALVGISTLGGISGWLVFNRQTEIIIHQLQIRDHKIREMEADIQSQNNKNLGLLMRDMLENINKELKKSPHRLLTDSSIAQIAAFSRLLKPYQYSGQDSLSECAYSPERGQLLKALVLLDLDKGTFGLIKRRAVFLGADLQQVDFKGVDMSGINLYGANLKEAILSEANLNGANLEKAFLWGANLNGANVNNANLKKADLSWAKLNNATLIGTNLSGAMLLNAQFIKALMSDASMLWARCDGALFNEANMTKVNFTGTHFIRANFNSATLNDTDLRKTNLSEADLIKIYLNNVFVDENWPEKLKKWQPIGIKALQEEYSLVNDTVDNGNRPLYRLKRNKY